MMGASTAGFQPITPTNFPLSSPRSIVFSKLRSDGYVASTGRLTQFTREQDEQNWLAAHRVSIDLGTQGVWLALGTDYVLVFRQKAVPLAFNHQLEPIELQLQMAFDWEHTSIASVDFDESVNRAVLLTLDGAAYSLHADGHTKSKTLTLRGGSLPITDADTVAFDSQHRCWVSHQVDRITVLDLETANRFVRSIRRCKVGEK